MIERTGTHILVVDDDAQVRASIGRLLEREGYSCALAADAQDARRSLTDGGFALLLCDVHMPGGSGFTLVREALAELPGLVALMLTGHYHVGLPDIARDCGASGFLSKPFKPEQLVAMVEKALKQPGAAASALRERRQRSYRDFSSEDRLRVVAEGLCGESSVVEACRRNGITESLYRTWHERALRAVGGQGQPSGHESFERALARQPGPAALGRRR